MNISAEEAGRIAVTIADMSPKDVFAELHSFRNKDVGRVNIDFSEEHINGLNSGRARHCLLAVKLHEAGVKAEQQAQSVDLTQASF